MTSRNSLLFTLLFSIFLFVSTNSKAQYSISGLLMDSTAKESLPFATIVLYSAKKDSILTATSSDLKGEFTLNNLKKGSYKLSIDFIGKDKLIISPIVIENKNIKLGTLYLKSGIQLGEVVIESKKSVAELKIDRKSFNISENQNAQGGSATDVLNNLPSVTVDQDGNISLRGNSNLRILIDGKPTGLNGENIALVLKQIPANTIENIEIITVPSSKYDAESSGGVINIILKENKLEGNFGNINLTYGNWDKVNSSFSYGIKKKKISLDLTYGFRYGNYFSDRNSTSSSSIIDSLQSFTISGAGKNNNPSHLGKLGLSYKINPKTELSLTSTLNIGNNLNTLNTNYEWLYYSAPSLKESRSANSGRNNNNVINTLSFQRNLKKKGESISFSSNHNYTDNNGTGTFLQDNAYQSEKNKLFSNEFNQNLDFVKIIKKSKLELGGQHTYRQITNDFVYNAVSTITNNFNYRDNISAAYAMFTGSIKSWAMALGYRMEHTFSESTNKSTNLNITRDYYNYFPSLNLSKKFSETSELGFNYSKRIARPNYNQLNPSPSYADPFSLRTGNPNLTPGLSDIAELSWLKRWKIITLQSTLFYQLRSNRPRRIRFIDANGVSNVMWVNYKSEDYFGLELFSTIRVNKNISTTFSANMYRRITDGTNIDPTFSVQFYGIDSKLNFSFKLPKDFLLQVNGEYYSKDVIVIGAILPRYYVDVALQKKILKDKGKIGLRVTDIFNTKVFRIQSDAQNWKQEAAFKFETRIAFLTFSYDFGKKFEKDQKDKKGTKKDSDEF